MAKDLSGPVVEGYSKEEIDKVQKLFDKYDLDMNCTLERSEFRQILVACGLRDVDAGKIFRACDANNSGAVEFKEFINWLFADSPEMDASRDADSQARMAKIHKHMDRGVMTKSEAMDDYFELLSEICQDYRYAKERNAVVPERSLLTKKTGDVEKNREVKVRDLFSAMDLNNNGKLTQSEFVRGMQTFGHTGDSEMISMIFHKLDQEKKNSRIWDRQYHKLKEEEDDAMDKALRRKEPKDRTWSILVGASEIFEKRDMKRWSAERREAILQAMKDEDDSLAAARERLKEEEANLEPVIAQKVQLEKKIGDKTVSHKEEDDKDNKELMKLRQQIADKEVIIEKLRNAPREARFHKTETKFKDGFIDLKEFQTSFKQWSGELESGSVVTKDTMDS
mmetsp:Transcript_94811/g.149976  ORF Transcript_94811/g.149976 Transcript_94811/m.149976 type:complete len:394 (+) Transcript_94811:76-1257(+)|eukprot:CAMPEP_0169125354 /NCGR_PEP_ID=MMETSP1015-20121227/34834_1 /TAXON_ID=342587 /ORGANISM="Karlodinium micrum, Strain CCMP2283" /LENGTH=393 /DNA_ID=CAMNT_0009188873 /DNA_START=56 /DNA_END=1237 /DNA_ORIENTATION=+